MKLLITRIDKTLPLPEYHTPGSVAFDIYSRVDISVPAQTIGRVPTNLIIKVPDGFALIIAARSSTSKKGLQLANGIGVIDQDYCGPEDEIYITVHNFTDLPVKISRAERFAQGFIIPIEIAEWTEGEPHSDNNRGGFGSTG